MTKDADTCESCRFWRRVDTGNLYDYEKDFLLSDEVDDLATVGHCQRFPPVFDAARNAELKADRMNASGYGNSDAVTFHRLMSSVFPFTDDYEWCGEFQPIPKD